MFLLQVKKKTKLYFVVEIITKITGFTILFLTIDKGIEVLCYGLIVQLFLQLLITSYFANMLIGGNMFIQLGIIIPYLVLGAITWGIITYFFSHLEYFSFLVYGSIMFVVFYGLSYFVLFKKHILEVLQLVKKNN